MTEIEGYTTHLRKISGRHTQIGQNFKPFLFNEIGVFCRVLEVFIVTKY